MSSQTLLSVRAVQQLSRLIEKVEAWRRENRSAQYGDRPSPVIAADRLLRDASDYLAVMLEHDCEHLMLGDPKPPTRPCVLNVATRIVVSNNELTICDDCRQILHRIWMGDRYAYVHSIPDIDPRDRRRVR